ncbi:hypothetical protein FOZ63_014611, partial [Perkinsus olseni]
YCRIPMRDNEQQVLGILYLKKAWDFIDDARKHADGNVLIHCIMGQSRSVIVLVSYLMRHLDIDYQAALDMVVSVRSMAEPNPGFERQLLDHDANGAIRGGGGGGTYLLPCPFQCLVLVPAMDLRTRLSADYSNVKLMEPDEDTYPKAAVLQVLGMISDGESYMEDKRMVLRGAVVPVPYERQISEAKVKGEAARGARASVLSGDDKAADLRAMPFVDPINEKLLPIGESRDGPHVQVGVVCRKGRKGTEDHTPNQDSFSVTLLDDNTVVGLVCDGHGPFGHLISQRSTQSAANLVCQRLRGADETTGIEAKLKAAVQECQDDIIRFANATGFPADNSGSSLACLVVEPLDRAANKLVVHVAWCGDSKVVAGKYDKKDVETIVKETKDHTPEDPAEAKRIDERGGEMREIAGGSKRIFVKGTNLPGLAITRAIGDLSVTDYGVISEPQYERWEFSASDSIFIIAGSDGVWEFMKAEEAHKIVNKKLRLRTQWETAELLDACARKRWETVEADYCDDITNMIFRLGIPSHLRRQTTQVEN